MNYLILGLIIFLGVHSVRMVADDWRTLVRQRLGEGIWKGLYSLVSLAGLALIAWGFDAARDNLLLLWSPPVVMRQLAALLTLLSFVLLAAAYVPGNGIKARLHHPMVLGVKVWALAHLLSNGMQAHVLLFGTFLIWSVFNFRSARQRDREAGTVYPAGNVRATAIAIALGTAAWAIFAFGLHGLLIGVKPMG
jgi:uncharacterized membrane protein